jgi:hypothetical protein
MVAFPPQGPCDQAHTHHDRKPCYRVDDRHNSGCQGHNRATNPSACWDGGMRGPELKRLCLLSPDVEHNRAAAAALRNLALLVRQEAVRCGGRCEDSCVHWVVEPTEPINDENKPYVVSGRCHP